MPSAFGQRQCAPLPSPPRSHNWRPRKERSKRPCAALSACFSYAALWRLLRKVCRCPLETGIDVQEQTAESLSQEVLRQTADGFGSNVHQIIEEALSAKQIFPEEICVSVHVGEDDDIYINSIAIWLEKDTLSNTEEILRIVSEKTGVIPEILAGGEEVS